MINTVLRFEYSTNGVFAGSYEDFSEDEVPELTINYECPHKLIRGYYRRYMIFRTGMPYKIFTVEFYPHFGHTTLAKIENLFKSRWYGHPDFLKMYYEYGENTSSCAIVKMIRQDYKVSYDSGYLSNSTFKIRFVETNLENVAVLHIPPKIGV